MESKRHNGDTVAGIEGGRGVRSAPVENHGAEIAQRVDGPHSNNDEPEGHRKQRVTHRERWDRFNEFRASRPLVSYFSVNSPWNAARNVGESLRIQSTWTKNRLVGQVGIRSKRDLNRRLYSWGYGLIGPESGQVVELCVATRNSFRDERRKGSILDQFVLCTPLKTKALRALIVGS